MPKTAEQNPKYSILGSQPRARNCSFEYAQLLTWGKDLEAKVAAATGESVRHVRELIKNGIMSWDL